MKFNVFVLAFAAIGCASAQSVSWVSPTPGSTIVAGQPFEAVVQLQNSLSSVNVLTLAFGLQIANQPSGPELGETLLGTVFQPQFVFVANEGFINSTTLTIPTDLFTGLNQNYTLTVGEFFLLGAVQTPETFTADVSTVFVSS